MMYARLARVLRSALYLAPRPPHPAMSITQGHAKRLLWVVVLIMRVHSGGRDVYLLLLPHASTHMFPSCLALMEGRDGAHRDDGLDRGVVGIAPRGIEPAELRPSQAIRHGGRVARLVPSCLVPGDQWYVG
jgi:hypothetical protein